MKMSIALALLAALTGCAGSAGTTQQAPDQPEYITGKTCAAGCDKDWCWPAFTLTRPTIVRRVTRPASSHPGGRAYAYALPYSGPVCQIILPTHLGYAAQLSGYTLPGLECHEAWHCMGNNHTTNKGD